MKRLKLKLLKLLKLPQLLKLLLLIFLKLTGLLRLLRPCFLARICFQLCLQSLHLPSYRLPIRFGPVLIAIYSWFLLRLRLYLDLYHGPRF